MSEYIGQNQYSGLSTEDRFWQKVDIKDGDECWEWLGSVHHQWGYGGFNINGKCTASHRFSWEWHYGKVPIEMCVCHHCDNPKCVRPDHLFLGTNQDNTNDMVNKGRSANSVGENNSNSKLTEIQVIEIRKLYDLKKRNGGKIARKYGIVKETVYDIVHRKRWKHI